MCIQRSKNGSLREVGMGEGNKGEGRGVFSWFYYTQYKR